MTFVRTISRCDWEFAQRRVRKADWAFFISYLGVVAAEWLRTNEATVALQTSRKTMTRRINYGYFVLGDHFVQIGPHKTATRIWKIERYRETQARWDGPAPVC